MSRGQPYFLRFLFPVFVIGLLLFGAYALYNAGQANGYAMAAMQIGPAYAAPQPAPGYVAPQPGYQAPYYPPVYGNPYYHRPFGFFPFPFFGLLCLVPLLFFFFFRPWRRGWGHHGPHGHHCRGEAPPWAKNEPPAGETVPPEQAQPDYNPEE